MQSSPRREIIKIESILLYIYEQLDAKPYTECGTRVYNNILLLHCFLAQCLRVNHKCLLVQCNVETF